MFFFLNWCIEFYPYPPSCRVNQQTTVLSPSTHRLFCHSDLCWYMRALMSYKCSVTFSICSRTLFELLRYMSKQYSVLEQMNFVKISNSEKAEGGKASSFVVTHFSSLILIFKYLFSPTTHYNQKDCYTPTKHF